MSQKPYALVTGASSGIGFQYARLLAERGYNLLIISNEEAIIEKGEALKSTYGVEVLSWVQDLALPDAAHRVFEACNERQLMVEVLINNAGIYRSSDFLDAPLDFNEKMLHLHVTTPALLCYLLGSEMKKRHRGYILNMSSITGSMPVQTLALYGSTKRFLRNFSRSLHIELRALGVHVTAVCPGAVATNLYNLTPRMVKIGTRMGIISSPESLARKGLKALFAGRVSVTPGVVHRVVRSLVQWLPSWVLRAVRRWGIY